MSSYHNMQPGHNPQHQGGYHQSAARGEHTTIYLGTDPSRSLFSTKEIRAAFVSKVYSILFVQLLVASALIAWFTLHEPTKNYFKQWGALWLYAALAVGMVVYFVLLCVESTRRSFPINLILLALLTLAFGLIAAVFSARFETVTVLCAFGATALATLVVMLLAKFSPFDITDCGCALCVLGLVHVVFALVLTLVLVPTNTASLLIAGSGALLVSIYLLFDLQLIMGGRTVELSPEEYILAAVMLYIDIINLFQYMLILFGSRE